VSGDGLVRCGEHADVGHVHRVVPRCSEPGCDFGGEVGVDEQPHGLGRAGERQFVFLERVGGEFEGGQDVGSFQVRVVGQDLFG